MGRCNDEQRFFDSIGCKCLCFQAAEELTEVLKRFVGELGIPHALDRALESVQQVQTGARVNLPKLEEDGFAAQLAELLRRIHLDPQ